MPRGALEFPDDIVLAAMNKIEMDEETFGIATKTQIGKVENLPSTVLEDRTE